MKKTICLVMVFTILFSLVACGKVDPTVAETDPISLEELFSTVGTLKADEITDSKVLPYVYEIEDGTVQSQKIDTSILQQEWIANTPEEVGYIVHFKYCASQNKQYIGTVKVFNTFITAEIQDVLSNKIIATKTISGDAPPEHITSNSDQYYAAYPDETELKEWVYQSIQIDREKKHFAAVGTLNASEITGSKVLPYVYEIEDGTVQSQKIDRTLLSQEWTADEPEEVRYIVHFKYCAKENKFYYGSAQVYNCSIEVEIQDVLSADVLAAKTFQGGELPESAVVSDTGKYYADYPDEAEIIKWIYQNLQAAGEVEMAANEAKMAEALSLAQSIIDSGCFSYTGLIESLMDEELSGYTYEEAVYAADNCGADWNEEAMESAARYVGWGINEKEMLTEMLEEDGFTHEQAVYGAENSGL